MFHLARNILNNLKIRGFQQIVARSSHVKHSSDFHDNYGNALLAGGASFCVVAWLIYITQMGVKWNVTPIGRVTPKEWKQI